MSKITGKTSDSVLAEKQECCERRVAMNRESTGRWPTEKQANELRKRRGQMDWATEETETTDGGTPKSTQQSSKNTPLSSPDRSSSVEMSSPDDGLGSNSSQSKKNSGGRSGGSGGAGSGGGKGPGVDGKQGGSDDSEDEDPELEPDRADRNRNSV